METRIIPALLIAIGVALAGWFAGQGLLAARSVDRFVTVKGLSEREVQADLALWPMQFVVADDDLDRAQARMVEATQRVHAFLARGGFAPGEIVTAADGTARFGVPALPEAGTVLVVLRAGERDGPLASFEFQVQSVPLEEEDGGGLPAAEVPGHAASPD